MTDCHIRHANSAPIKRLRMPLLVMLLLLQLTSLPLLAKTTGNLQKWLNCSRWDSSIKTPPFG